MEEELINFKISAPGRIVLSGEHSATYGKHLVAAGLNLRTKLEFWELPESQRIISIDFLRVDLQKDIFLENVENYFFHTNLSEIHTNPINFLRYVTYFITTHGMWKTYEQRFSLQIFFYLFYAMTYDLERKPFGVRVSTDLPEGSGLGSSTSFAVCLAACFLHWRCLQNGHHIGFDDEQLRIIKRYTESCEDVMQEDMFPWIDAEICIYGKIRSHQHTHYKSLFTSIINLQTVIKILIIATGRYQRKKTQVQLMAKMKSSYSNFDSIINKLDEFATTIYDRLDYINCNRDNVHPITHESAYENAYMNLQDAIRKNQQLLKKYHLSSLHMDNEVLKIASGFGYGAKITGFGGRFAYIVLQPNITDMEMDLLREAFHSKMLRTAVATIDCEGVKIDNLF